MNTIYEVGYIYKLVCSETGKCYFGSTTNPISRLLRHKGKSNTCTSKELKNPTMHILEVKEDITKSNLEYIEKYYILNNDCVNKNIPKRTSKEWYNDQIQQNPDYHKEKYIMYGGNARNNRTRQVCECGGKYVQRNLKIHLGTKIHKKYIDNI